MSKSTETMIGIDTDLDPVYLELTKVVQEKQHLQNEYDQLEIIHRSLQQEHESLRELYRKLNEQVASTEERWQETLTEIRAYVIENAVTPGDVCVDEANRFFQNFGMEEYTPTQSVTLTLKLTVEDVPNAENLDQGSATQLIPFFRIMGSDRFSGCGINLDSVSIDYIGD